MSDLPGGNFGSAGLGRPIGQGAGAQASPSGGIRTPRDILNAREARRRAEEAELSKNNDNAQRTIDLERRRSAERRAAAAGIAAHARDSGYRTAGGQTPGDVAYSTPVPTSGSIPQEQYARAGGFTTPATSRSRAASDRTAQQSAPPPSSYTQQPPATTRTAQATSQPYQQQASSADRPAAQTQAAPQPAAQPKSSGFPHAFERWEQLSGQWEGVTSHWIRVLELHAQEMAGTSDRPTIEHMGRYITDLSAAGANLFHAVVELQRLRASSERKFQRWFFETREQQQREMEETSKLRAELQAERSRNAGAAAQADFERQRLEMKREMQIAKEEARRAWEELGRREEMEREQHYALREGHAVFVGGVQVLPSAVISRGGSSRPLDTREQYATQPGVSGQEYELQEPSPTDTDPFTEGVRSSQRPHYRPIGTGMPPYTTTTPTPAPAAPPSSQSQPPGTFYRQPDTLLHEPQSQVAGPSRSAFSSPESEEELGPELDAQGNVKLDAQGRPIPFRGSKAAAAAGSVTAPTTTVASSVTMPPPPIPPSALRQQQVQSGQLPEVISSPESSEAGDEDAYNTTEQARYAQGPQRTAARVSPADYEGEGFGSGQGWEEMETRHHHPTRLSDVMEEDERSRASGSRASPGAY